MARPIYRSRLNAKINRNFEAFTATGFLAAITQHIPDKGAQMVRYYGWYSNKMRGVRQRGLPPELVARRPGVSPPPPVKLPSKRWRDLILRVWHVDPLRCPVCQNPMRVIALIDDPRVVEKILRDLGAWRDPPPRPPPQGVPGPYTCEPCDDVDPTPRLRKRPHRLSPVGCQAGLKPALCPAPASSGPVCPGIALLLAHCLAAWPLPPAYALGDRAKPKQNRQNLTLDAIRKFWQDGAAMNESENQFSFTRAALSTSGRAKNQIPISISF